MNANTANYLRTLPLYSSQYEQTREADYSIFRFEIAPTYDFIQELRKQGPNLQVLAPEWLRQDFIRDHQAALEDYDNMRGFDPVFEDDFEDNGMTRYSENDDEEGWS